MNPHTINLGIGVAVWFAIWLNHRAEHRSSEKGKS